MKKIVLILVSPLIFSCSNDKTIKEVIVEKEVEVPVEVEINIFEKTERHVKTLERITME